MRAIVSMYLGCVIRVFHWHVGVQCWRQQNFKLVCVAVHCPAAQRWCVERLLSGESYQTQALEVSVSGGLPVSGGKMGGNGGKWGEKGGNGELLQIHHGKCMKMSQEQRKMGGNGGGVKNGTCSGNFPIFPGPIFRRADKSFLRGPLQKFSLRVSSGKMGEIQGLWRSPGKPETSKGCKHACSATAFHLHTVSYGSPTYRTAAECFVKKNGPGAFVGACARSQMSVEWRCGCMHASPSCSESAQSMLSECAMGDPTVVSIRINVGAQASAPRATEWCRKRDVLTGACRGRTVQ